MNQLHAVTTTQSAAQFHRFDAGAPRLAEQPAMVEERLPFTVKLVRSQEDLWKAVHIRHSAYRRHVPTFAETLKSPEMSDSDNGVVVLLAESKLDGSALGSMRIQTNRFKPLSIEQSVELPGWLSARPLAEATRLGVTDEKVGRIVTTVLFKAFFQYCRLNCIEWMVITGRSPVDRMYDRLLFEDVYPGMGYVPVRHVSNIPHRIMSFEVDTAEARWAAAKHPLFNFIFRTFHADIDVGIGAAPNAAVFHPAELAAAA